MSSSRSGDESLSGEAGDKSWAEAVTVAGAVESPGGAGGGVGRLVDSSQADDRRMIALVRSRRLLYARNNMPVAKYYAQVKRLWEEVADEMGRSVAEVRRKWSHIRNSYSRHLRNEVGGARTGRGRAVSRWYLADELEFLKEHMATDTRIAPSAKLFTYTPHFLEMDMSETPAAEVNVCTEPVDVKPFTNATWFGLGAASAAAAAATATVTSPVRLEPKQELHSVFNGGDDESSSSFTTNQDDETSYYQFFRGLYSDYNELYPQRRRLFRRQCLALLHGLLDEQDGEAPPPGALLSPAPLPAAAPARASTRAAAAAARLHRASTEHADAILPND